MADNNSLGNNLGKLVGSISDFEQLSKLQLESGRNSFEYRDKLMKLVEDAPVNEKTLQQVTVIQDKAFLASELGMLHMNAGLILLTLSSIIKAISALPNTEEFEKVKSLVQAQDSNVVATLAPLKKYLDDVKKAQQRNAEYLG